MYRLSIFAISLILIVASIVWAGGDLFLAIILGLVGAYFLAKYLTQSGDVKRASVA